MKKFLLFLITLTAGIIFSDCSRKVQHSLTTRSPEMIEAIMENPLAVRNNFFAFDLLRNVFTEQDNIVASPFSMSTALAMTFAGARGLTAEEMANTLYFSSEQDSFHNEFGAYINEVKAMSGENLQINLANSLWAHEDYYFLPEFFAIMEQQYESELFQVNYKGNRELIRQDINKWVLDQTREKIDNLIAPGVLTEDTRLVLVNAIHFLGNWTARFNENLTRKQTFSAINGQEKSIDFMTQKSYHRYFENEKLQALEKPYANGQFSMVILLPKKNTNIHTMLKDMDGETFQHIMQHMQRTHVDLQLPKFKIESSFYLEETLGQMGMPLAFTRKADFSGMTGTDSLMIDKVIHKAMIDVMESGTEAAAATAIVMITKTSIDPDPERTVIFNADRPFLYFIKENNHDGILFLGSFVKP